MDAPVPHDIPLPLPAPQGFLEFLLVGFFLLHIVFVHLMVGSSLFSLVCQIKGLRVTDYDKLAHKIVSTITVNKSLAVVFGVGPLLVINTIYTPYFYASSALIGDAWMSVIPLVAIAFLLAYAHKYWWQRLAIAKELHIGIAVLEASIFLIVPLIFMTNVNLMLFPDKWPLVKGFLSAVLLPNVLQRYLHFISGCVLFSALFLAWWTGRNTFKEDSEFSSLRIIDVRRFFLGFAFGATVLQLLSGLLVFVTLPAIGLSWRVTLTLFVGSIPAIFAMYWMWLDITGEDTAVGKRLSKTLWAFLFTVVAMGAARHDYRENALHDHKLAVAKKTENYMAAVQSAQREALLTAESSASPQQSVGEKGFQQNCSGCHSADVKTVGPSLKEIRSIYGNNIEGIVKWASVPGKKRPDSMQMPSFGGRVSASELEQIARYILIKQAPQ